MKQYLLFFFFIFTALGGLSQNDLTQVKIELTKKKIDSVFEYGNIANSKSLINQLINDSKQGFDFNSECEGYIYLSTYNRTIGNTSEAKTYAEKAHATRGISELNKTKSLLHISLAYKESRDYQKAIDTAFKAIENDKSNADLLCVLFHTIATSYFNKEDEENALKYYLKSIEESKKHETKQAHLITLNSTQGLSWLYINRKEYDRAESYLLPALQVSKERGLLTQQAQIERILGKVYLDQDNFEKAILHQTNSLKHAKETGYNLMAFDLSNQLSRSYLKQGKKTESLQYAKEALSYASLTQDTLAINAATLGLAEAQTALGKLDQASRLLSQIGQDTNNKERWPSYLVTQLFAAQINLEEARGNYKKSFLLLRKQKKHQDSLKLARHNTNVVDIETKYQSETKEKENLQLKSEKAAQARLIAIQGKHKWSLAGGLTFAILGLGVLAICYRKNERQKKHIGNIQEELHHRVKNNLAFIDFFIQVTKDDITDSNTHNRLTQLQNRIDSIHQVHYQLYESKKIMHLDMRTYVDTLSTNISNAFSASNVSIENNINQDLTLQTDKSFPIGLIINEFLTNSFKYAFTGGAGKISINLRHHEDQYYLTLKDNGKGLPENFDLKKDASFGIRIMKLLSQQLNGSFELVNKNGLQINLQFPK